MQEPNPRTSRLVIAGGVAAVIVISGGGFLVGRATAPVPPAPPPVVIEPPTLLPVPEVRIIRRRDLIALAEQAADAFASGKPLPASIRDAAGRHFELVLPIGCAGPSEPNSTLSMQWRYDEGEQALRVSVTPVTWRAAEWGFENSSGAAAAEGFWITRPWSALETCAPHYAQATPAGVEPVTLSGQTLAVAQFVTDDAERNNRRIGNPFETVQRLPIDRIDPQQGLRLRVKGRIARLPDNTPARCIQPGGPDQRPICVIGVRMDEITIENPASEEALATWTLGRR